MRLRAHDVGEQMRAENGLERATAAIEELTVSKKRR